MIDREYRIHSGGLASFIGWIDHAWKQLGEPYGQHLPDLTGLRETRPATPMSRYSRNARDVGPSSTQMPMSVRSQAFVQK